MDVRIDDSWCTVQEFCRITSWHLTQRRLRQLIQENCFPYPAIKVSYSSKKFLYMIQLTDPVQVAALKRLREIRHEHKRAYERAENIFGKNCDRGIRPVPAKWRTIRVNISGYEYVLIQSPEFLRSLHDYIKETGRDITIRKEKFGSIFIRLPREVYYELSNIARRSTCSIGNALYGLFQEFMKTPQGKAAAIFAIKLQHLGLHRKKSSIKEAE